jgi:hypothetical protein
MFGSTESKQVDSSIQSRARGLLDAGAHKPDFTTFNPVSVLPLHL